MQIDTKYFGKVEVEEENIFTFEEGIFGFGEYKKYTVIYESKSENSLICWLQSTEDKDVVLPLIATPLLLSDYHPEISDEQILKIGELRQEELLLYTVIVVPEDIKKISTNLKAPILMNLKTKKGIQVIIERDEYPIKYYLYDQLQSHRQKGGE